MHKPLIACAFALVLTAPAQAADVDWKVYGTTSIDGGLVCFYEGKGIIARAPSTLRVWTKCLLQRDLDNIDPQSELGKKLSRPPVERWARATYHHSHWSKILTSTKPSVSSGTRKPQTLVTFSRTHSSSMN